MYERQRDKRKILFFMLFILGVKLCHHVKKKQQICWGTN